MEEQSREARKPGRLGRPESAAWGSLLLLGVLWTVVGVLCLVATEVASVAAVYYVGALLAIGGVVSVVWGFRGAAGGALVLGILSLVVGVLMLVHPQAGLVSLTMLLIGYFFIAGLYRVVTPLVGRYPGWGLEFASGLCAIVIGVIAVRAWPATTFLLLGILVGAELIVRGLFMIAAAVSVRRVMRGLKAAP